MTSNFDDAARDISEKKVHRWAETPFPLNTPVYIQIYIYMYPEIYNVYIYKYSSYLIHTDSQPRMFTLCCQCPMVQVGVPGCVGGQHWSMTRVVKVPK